MVLARPLLLSAAASSWHRKFPTPYLPSAATCIFDQRRRRSFAIVSKSISEAQEVASSRPPRFYVEGQLPQHPGELSELGVEESKHASKALRLVEGDHVEVCDGRGGLVLAQIAAASKKAVTVEAIADARQDAWRGPQWEVVAGCSMLKGGRADWLVEKCTELGARSLLPLVSERVHGAGAGWKLDARPSKNKEDSPHGRQARWERVAAAATKQSLRRHSVSHLQAARPVAAAADATGRFDAAEMSLAEFLPEVSAARLAFIAAAGAPELLSDRGLQQGLAALGDGERALLIVGPEGDFTPAELEQLVQAGALPVGLGPLRLRVETAAIALLAATCTFHRSRQRVTEA